MKNLIYCTFLVLFFASVSIAQNRSLPSVEVKTLEGDALNIQEIENKGNVRPIEISKLLHVKSATVTSMLKKLHDNKLVIYEKYRGAILSNDGKELAKLIVSKHKILVEFLELVTTNKLEAHTNAEKIEHYLEYSTINRINLITKLIKEDKDIYKKVQKIIGR